MKPPNRFAVVVAAALGLLAGCGRHDAPSTPVKRVGVEFTVVRDGEEVFCFCADVAGTELERQRGLSGSGDPAPFDAMAFMWGEPTTPSFWMKDTPRSLDAVFVGVDGVVDSVQRMEPCVSGDCSVYSASRRGRLALETRDAAKLGLRAGDRLMLQGECAR